MSVDIGQAIEEGGRRTFARNGLYLVVITWVLGVLNALFGNTIARTAFEQFQGPGGPGGMPFDPGQAPMGPSLGIPSGIAWVLSIVVGLVGVVVVGAAFRTFVAGDTETLPAERFTRNVGWMWINLFIGWIVFWIAVTIGLILLVIPGLFLLTALFFWGVYVAVEDENFVDAFGSSWSATSGNRLRLFVLGVVVVIITLVVNWIFGIPRMAGLTGWLGLLIGQIGTAVALVFILATTARTYLQLEAEEEAPAAE